MVNPIPESVQKIWDEWNIRGALLFSLLLQILLICFAPLRKRTNRKLIIMMIWSCYLLADATANFAVGLISNTAKAKKVNSELLAFWAPFLLLHLGGLDTITAFSLEDNELWLRHLLALVSQAIATGYVFVQTLPSVEFTIPTLLLFLAGIIKYIERTRSLYLASMDRFRDSMIKEPDPGPDYALIMEKYASTKQAKPNSRIIMISEIEMVTGKGTNPSGVAPKSIKLNDQLQVVHIAFDFFKTFKGLVVDLIFSFKQRSETRQFFNSISAEDSLRIIETELNFICEVLFTKVVVLHSRWGCFFRFVVFSSVVTALYIFHFRVNKDHFDGFDLGVTYALLYGAIGLDIIAFGMIILSDWRAAAVKPSDKIPETRWESIASFFNSFSVRIFRKLLVFRRLRWSPYELDHNNQFTALATPVFLRRWSGRVSGHNLIRYCLKGRPRKKTKGTCEYRFEKVVRFTHTETLIQLFGILKEKVVALTGLKDFVDEVTYLSKEQLTKELWEFVFYELQRKSLFADNLKTAKKLCSTRGDWFVQDRDPEKYGALLCYTTKVSYDQSLLTWHIATELLYNTEDRESSSNHHREFSKILSDYMLYLLIMQPTLMSAVAGIGKIRFRDTCAEAERFFKEKGFKPDDETKACKSVLYLNTAVEPVSVKGDRRKSVLFDGSMLAKELRKLEDEKWLIMSKVWVELMSYTAINCSANAQAQQLSKGGERITLLWLLMAHFGLGDQFQMNEAQARA